MLSKNEFDLIPKGHLATDSESSYIAEKITQTTLLNKFILAFLNAELRMD